jgi:hypothetical protein
LKESPPKKAKPDEGAIVNKTVEETNSLYSVKVVKLPKLTLRKFWLSKMVEFSGMKKETLVS